jgi:hypothetical protein
MDNELVERLAYDAGLGDLSLAPKHGLDLYAAGITRFASLIAEECAKACEQLPPPYARDIEREDFAQTIREKFKAA